MENEFGPKGSEMGAPMKTDQLYPDERLKKKWVHHRQPIFPWISIPRSERASGKAAHSLLQRLSRGSWGSLLRGVQMRATRPASSTSTTSEDKLDDGDDGPVWGPRSRGLSAKNAE